MEQAQPDGSARDAESIACIRMMAATIAAGMGKDIAEVVAQADGERLLGVIGKAAATVALAIHEAVQRAERSDGHVHEVRRG